MFFSVPLRVSNWTKRSLGGKRSNRAQTTSALLCGMPQSVRRRAEEAPEMCRNDSPPFYDWPTLAESRRHGLNASAKGPLPVREPACGLRVGVPAAAAVPGAPEVSSELEELAAALRPAEDETCDGLES